MENMIKTEENNATNSWLKRWKNKEPGKRCCKSKWKTAGLCCCACGVVEEDQTLLFQSPRCDT